MLKKTNQNNSANLSVYQIDVDSKGVKGGNSKEVDAIATKYNFHSHPEAAYMAHNCELGWPSRDDYITFLDGFFKFTTTFHIIASKEGLYILKINPCAIKKLKEFYAGLSQDNQEKFINNVDDWADKFINISKSGLTRAKGKRAPTGELIKTEAEYIEFVNNTVCNKIKCNDMMDSPSSLELSMPIFDIGYISWEDASSQQDNEKGTFTFTVEKTKSGKCKIL